MSGDLKHKAAIGILWKFLEQGGVQFLQFASGIYIARLLLPEHYGLIGMMAIFLGISRVFIDSGFKVALIQKGIDTTTDDYNVVFYFNISIAIIFCLLIYSFAPAISRFYDEPKLIPVARALGFNLIIGSFSIIQQVILEKRLNFRTNARIRILSVLLSVITGIALAILGFGVWSLVIMTIVESFVRSSAYWIFNSWRPTLKFDIKSFRSLFSNGSKILFNSIMGQLNQNIYSLIIGKYFTTIDVGYYDQGRKIQKRIGDFISQSMQGVMFPVLSLIKDDFLRLKRSVRKNVLVTTLVSFPAVAGLISVAKPFVLLFLTEKWLDSVYYLQVLSLAGLLFIANQAIKSYLIPIGKFNFIVVYGIVSNTVLIAMIAASIVFKKDLKLIVAVKVVHEFLNFIVVTYFSKRFINYRFREIMADVMPASSFSIIMGFAVYLIGVKFGVSFIVLGAQVISGLVIYTTLNYLFHRKIFFEFYELLKVKLKK